MRIWAHCNARGVSVFALRMAWYFLCLRWPLLQLDGIITELRSLQDNVLVGLYSATQSVQLQEAAQEWLERHFVMLFNGRGALTAANVVEEFVPVLPGMAQGATSARHPRAAEEDGADDRQRPTMEDRLWVLRRFLPTDERCVVFCNTKEDADWYECVLRMCFEVRSRSGSGKQSKAKQST